MIAARLPEPIEKGLPGTGLLAHVITSKFADHLPLYRQEAIFRRHGVALARSTMCDWMAACAGLLEPIVKAMIRRILGSKMIGTVGSGARERSGRDGLLKAVRRHEVDVVVVRRMDRWGRSLPDLVVTLRKLTELGVGFVSLTEALDLTTPTGRAITGMLAVFAEFEREILRERVRAGIAQARKEGRPHGRLRTASLKADQVLRLEGERVSHSEIARRLGIGRTSVGVGIANGQEPTLCGERWFSVARSALDDASDRRRWSVAEGPGPVASGSAAYRASACSPTSLQNSAAGL